MSEVPVVKGINSFKLALNGPSIKDVSVLSFA